MTYIQDVVQKVIDILDADASLSSPTNIRRYYFGAPKDIPPRLPIIYVQFNGREYTGESDISRFLHALEIEIGIIDRHVNEDTAEKSVFDKIEAVETALDGNPTLDSLVVSNELSPREVEVVHGADERYAVTVGKIFCLYRKWLP